MGFLFLYVITVMVQYASSLTIDEQISAAAQKARERAGGVTHLSKEDEIVVVELDIVYKKREWMEMQQLNRRSRSKRKAIRDERRRWTNKEIPYVIKTKLNTIEEKAMYAAFSEYHQYTCVKFRPRTSSDKNYITIEDGDGCSSYEGMIGGPQDVTLGDGCRSKGVIVHELGHAVGLIHEHSRPDRDDYVEILKHNVNLTEEDYKTNFGKESFKRVNTYNIKYDYFSIMHYGPRYFSKGFMITIRTKDPSKQYIIGNRKGLSFRDNKIVNLMYECSSHCQTKPACLGEGFVAKDCKCWCPDNNPGSPGKLCTTVPPIIQTTVPGPTVRPSTVYPITTPTVPQPTVPMRSVCIDADWRCSDWAKRGECESTPDYMLVFCRRSCNRCGTASRLVCMDTDIRCAYWAARRECHKSPYYMLVFCRKSCGRCNAENLLVCEDSDTRCADWAAKGECDKTPDYMLVNCKRSCDWCFFATESDTPPCIDYDVRCSRWANMGKCSDNPGLMVAQCKRSCKMC